MEWLFDGCYELKEIKGINNFITNKVTNMRSMFEFCNELESLDLSNFDTSNVTNMENLFHKCRKLKEIKGINNFNTKNVTNMRAMFRDCNVLKYLNLSNFITINVKNMYKMFSECFDLEFLDLSNFDTSNVTDTSYMFNKCYELKEIKGINNFNLDKIIRKEEMFSECNNELKKNNKLISQLNKSNQNIEQINQEKKLITVIFNSSSQHIKQFPLSCYNTDSFLILEEKLFLEKPELKHKKIFYMANGAVLDTSLSLEQNKINDNDAILINDDDIKNDDINPQ